MEESRGRAQLNMLRAKNEHECNLKRIDGENAYNMEKLNIEKQNNSYKNQQELKKLIIIMKKICHVFKLNQILQIISMNNPWQKLIMILICKWRIEEH